MTIEIDIDAANFDVDSDCPGWEYYILSFWNPFPADDIF